MTSLLVQSCSSTKLEVEEPTEALKVYDGYFYKIIKKAIREGEFRSDLEICILSAEHGIIEESEKITPYDRKMTTGRAIELRDTVQKTLVSRVRTNDYSTVIVNAGKEYRRALMGFGDKVEAEVISIEGNGIGDKGKTVKQIVREDTLLTGGVR